MVRTAGLLSFPRRLPRFTTPSHPSAVAACYVALWRLPRPDFHRLVIRDMRPVRPRQGTPCCCWTVVVDVAQPSATESSDRDSPAS